MSAHLIVQREAQDTSPEITSTPKSDSVSQRLQFLRQARVDNLFGAITLIALVAFLGIAVYFAVKYLL
jgi:hypothetical protein